MKQKPCFKPSGILLKYYGNTRNGLVLKFTEPSNKADPQSGDRDWCLFKFEDDQMVEGAEAQHSLRKSVSLIGSSPAVCDIVLFG